MYDDKTITRFWAQVDRSGGAGVCWLWLGAPIKRGGYGQFSVKVAASQGNANAYGWKMMRAHRVAWELSNGRLLARTEHVLHRCDVPLCMNPGHHFLGDQKANMADMRGKGRGALPPLRRGNEWLPRI